MADSKPATVVTALRGLDERWEPPATEAGGLSAVEATDLWWHPRGGWQSSGGYDRLIRGPSAGGGTYTNPWASSGAIESIHSFSQHNGARRWIIYIDGSGNLLVLNPSTAARSGSSGDAAKDRDGNTITRTVINNPWIRSQSATFGTMPYFYMVNGTDRALVFDGYTWDYAGWTAPAGTPSAALLDQPLANDGLEGGTFSIKMRRVGLGQTDATDDYKFARRYCMTEVNARGNESPMSAPSEVIDFTVTGGDDEDDGARFAKVSLPRGGTSCVKRRVYCTQNLYDSSNTIVAGRDSQFFFHSEVADNCSELFIDSKDDGAIGQALVDPASFGPWPTGAKVIVPFNGRMYAIDDAQVYYSRRGFAEMWPPNNVIPIEDGEKGPLTVLFATRDALLVARATAIYLVEDDGVNEPRARRLTGGAGWAAQNTVKEIPGLGVMGLSDSSVTLLKGTLQNEGVETQTFNTAVCLPTTMGRLNTSALLNACATVYHEDKEYWLAIPTLGAPNNRQVLVFHYEIREWTTRPYFPIASMLTLPASAGGHLLFASYAATTGVSPDGVAHLGIFMYSRGTPDKDGTAITPVYETNNISIASAYRTFKPLHVLVNCILHGDNELTLNAYGNDSQTALYSVAKRVLQQYPQDRLPVYGTVGGRTTALFGSGAVWQEWHHGTVRFDVSAAMTQPLFALALRFTPTTGKRYMTLLGFSLEIQGNDPIQTKPLRPDGT